MPTSPATPAPPRLPAVELLAAHAEHLRFWHWNQTGMPYWRLYVNDAGGARILAESRHDVLPGHVTLVAPHTPTRLRLACPVGHMFIHFVVAPPYHHPRPGVWTSRFDEHLAALTRELGLRLPLAHLPDHQPNRPPLDIRATWQVFELIAFALAAVPAGAWAAHAMDRRVHQAMLRVEKEITRSIAVEDLAADAGLSTAAFARMFRHAMGISPHRYILRRRIEIATRLLGSTDRDIDAIAAACGFCDRYHFTRVFSRHHGMGPARFRQQRPAQT